jgi:hypothetical protein
MFYLRRLRWAEHVAGTGEKRNIYKILGRKCEGKKQTIRKTYS